VELTTPPIKNTVTKLKKKQRRPRPTHGSRADYYDDDDCTKKYLHLSFFARLQLVKGFVVLSITANNCGHDQ